MEIRLSIIVIICALFSKNIFAQRLNKKDQSFIVGLFSDYGGYQYWSDHPMKKYEIAYLGDSESLNVNAFCRYIKSRKIESFFELSEGSTIRTEKFLNQTLNLFSFGSDIYIWDEYDDNLEYRILLGKIKCTKAKKELDAINYVLGAYISNHDKSETNPYLFSFANSVYKWKIVKMFLKDLGCKRIKVEKINSLPFCVKVYFKPNDLVRNELQRLKAEGWLGEYDRNFY